MTASGIGEIPTSAAADLLLQVVSTPVSVPSQTYINSASKRPKAPEMFSRKFQEPGKVTPELCQGEHAPLLLSLESGAHAFVLVHPSAFAEFPLAPFNFLCTTRT